MKIYTRKGDEGTTGLIGGTRVLKDNARIEAYGTLDELNSHIGLLRDMIGEDGPRAQLQHIQADLFTIGSHLASDPDKGKMALPDLPRHAPQEMEDWMDAYDLQLPALAAFILPGGHPAVSQCHIARCVARRAERRAVHLSQIAHVHSAVLVYLNRLSDFLFTLARHLAHTLGAEEIKWEPRKPTD